MRGSAAYRLSQAVARHLHSGGGLSERSVGRLASESGVLLVDSAATSPALSARPNPSPDVSASAGALGKPRCVRCGRALAYPLVFEGRSYGSSCVKRIGIPRTRGPYSTRNAGELAT